MSLVRCGCMVVLLIASVGIMGNAQDQKSFSTDDEINLILAQTERAMELYKPVIDQEETLMHERAGYAEAVARDRQAVNALEMAVKAFRSKPQGFNGPAGFAFFEWLDDATRNALLCANGASLESTVYMMAGGTDKANDLVHLGQSCTDASTLIYTVSENAGALYTRYIEAEEKLAREGYETTQKCVDILKKKDLQPKK